VAKKGRMETLPAAPPSLVLTVAARLRSNTVGVRKHGPGRLVPRAAGASQASNALGAAWGVTGTAGGEGVNPAIP
jgi:hypothetical protein